MLVKVTKEMFVIFYIFFCGSNLSMKNKIILTGTQKFKLKGKKKELVRSFLRSCPDYVQFSGL